jgi:hypothetical protein
MTHKPARSTASARPSADQAMTAFATALEAGASEKGLLRRWSAVVRARDGYRCVLCGSVERTAAHHICRKSFLSEARFLTGNGITLCGPCHREVHAGFNGRPDLSEPMDAQGGEKIETLAYLYAELAAHQRRSTLPVSFFFLSEQVLAKFKMFQTYDPYHPFDGPPVTQAAAIWRGAPLSMIEAVVRANFP